MTFRSCIVEDSRSTRFAFEWDGYLLSRIVPQLMYLRLRTVSSVACSLTSHYLKLQIQPTEAGPSWWSPFETSSCLMPEAACGHAG